MLRQKILRLLVRPVILTTLVGALFVTSADVTRNTVHATDPWCPACQGYYEACVEACPALSEPGHFACMNSCTLETRDCEYFKLLLHRKMAVWLSLSEVMPL